MPDTRTLGQRLEDAAILIADAEAEQRITPAHGSIFRSLLGVVEHALVPRGEAQANDVEPANPVFGGPIADAMR